MEEEIKIEGNIDINQALNEFEAKSAAEQVQQTAVKEKVPDVPKMVQLVMKWSGGAIKEQRQAEYVLLGFVIVVIGISLFLVFWGGFSSRGKATIPIPIGGVGDPNF